MTATTSENIYAQRKRVNENLGVELATVNDLITKLHPEGSYSDYIETSDRLTELELFWSLTRMKLTRIMFCFPTTIKTLRNDRSFIHGSYLADEIEKVTEQDIHGFTRRLEEVAADLRNKKNQYTQFPEIYDSLQKIVKLKHDQTLFKINMNSSYGSLGRG